MWDTHSIIIAICVVLAFIIYNIRFIQLLITSKKESKKITDATDAYFVFSVLFFLYGALIVTLIKYLTTGVY